MWPPFALQNRILVPLRCSFQNLRRSPLSFWYVSPPGFTNPDFTKDIITLVLVRCIVDETTLYLHGQITLCKSSRNRVHNKHLPDTSSSRDISFCRCPFHISPCFRRCNCCLSMDPLVECISMKKGTKLLLLICYLHKINGAMPQYTKLPWNQRTP